MTYGMIKEGRSWTCKFCKSGLRIEDKGCQKNHDDPPKDFIPGKVVTRYDYIYIMKVFVLWRGKKKKRE